ncbi:TPA: flippase [Streptococcus suis]|nr:flippase [Streptococcus suis]
MKSIRINMVLNVLRTALTVIFPFIIFQIASRRLLAGNLGKVDFSLSVVNYFQLFAGLGVSVYAIRESGKFRATKEKLEQFASEVFTINIISTIVSYFFLLLTIFFVPKLQEYWILIAVQSLIIVSTTLGLEWVNIIYEDYKYITFRTLIFQLTTLILVFFFIREPSDYLLYAIFSMFGKVLPEIMNFYHVRKRHIEVRLVIDSKIWRHLVPILIIFVNSLVISIYVNLDTTMIGFFKTDIDVGYYSVAVKIYSAIKAIFSAIISVTVARISLYYSNGGKDKVERLLSLMINYFTLIIIPAILLFVSVADSTIYIFFGEAYSSSVKPLQLLCLGVIFSVYASTITNSIFLPLGLERFSLVATTLGALVNLLLNIFLIPIWGIIGAAMTTFFAEFIVFIVAYIYLQKKHIVFFKFLNWKNLVLLVLCVIWNCSLYMSVHQMTSKTIQGLVLQLVVGIFPLLCSLVISMTKKWN